MIAFIGDIHGEWYVLENIDRKYGYMDDVKAYIHVGDFGLDPYNYDMFKELRLSKPLYWIDGNHEHFPYYDGITNVTEFFPNMFYVPRGTTLTIDGKNILFFGGASSVDKHWRTPMISWWPQEIPTIDQFNKAYNISEKIDIMVTHTPPTSTIISHFDPNDLLMFNLPTTWKCQVAHMVEELWNHHNNPELFCGHMHRYVQDRTVTILDINQIGFNKVN